MTNSPVSCESATSFIDRRRAGVLLHPTSLPGGDLGDDAYRFVDFLCAGSLSVWQFLPTGPTHGDGSPYQCLSVFAGSPRLIHWNYAVRDGWLQADTLAHDRANVLRLTHAGFEQRANGQARQEYRDFVERHGAWLEDYALFHALRHEHGQRHWVDWPAPLRDRVPAALAQARAMYAPRVELAKFEQFMFFRQWHALKRYANDRGVWLFGDVPIFVAHDSADVWARREQFALEANGLPRTVAGVPPDYFSKTGQLWGNPHYDWERMRAENFSWWQARMRTQLDLADILRIDHFRGFEACWEIPYGEKTAEHGRWVKAPGHELFQALRAHLPAMRIVAEDLGTITPEVNALRTVHGLPGMKILQFAFDSDAANPYLPHHHERNSVVYTGTHDNTTTLGWFQALSPSQQQRVHEYFGGGQEAMPWALIRCAFASVAQLAVIPMQDLLSLGAAHRMNTPGTIQGNWSWRFDWVQLDPGLSARLRRLVEIYGRS